MQLDQELQNVKSVAIAGHIRPDGDCVGSCLATYNYIRTYYPTVDVRVFLEPIPTIFHFLQGQIVSVMRPPVMMCLNCALF